MPDFYDFDRADARLPELRETLLRLRALRDEVVSVRDRIVELNAPALAGGVASTPPPARAEAELETKRLRMRLQGLVDQMQATVIQIDSWGIQLREIETGLVDFPALVSGRPVWLCWRLGEPATEHWHPADSGFKDRQPVDERFHRRSTSGNRPN